MASPGYITGESAVVLDRGQQSVRFSEIDLLSDTSNVVCP